eukprot:Amastigsp_a513074_51.p3 type:complete len:115 gc:universal Amastigsp_a513074_51:789-445(-)
MAEVHRGARTVKLGLELCTRGLILQRLLTNVLRFLLVNQELRLVLRQAELEDVQSRPELVKGADLEQQSRVDLGKRGRDLQSFTLEAHATEAQLCEPCSKGADRAALEPKNRAQ